ncbi:hypothetical protein GGD81_004094 [Rhodobium orientis]|nr:hypothetical protein [Rhodobium orientis]
MANLTVFPTEERLKTSRRLLIARLKKESSLRAWRALKRLSACSSETDEFCGLLACPVCRARAQKNFADAIESEFSRHAGFLSVTLIPKAGMVPPEDLMKFDLRAFVRSQYRRISKVLPAGHIFVGAVDFSFNMPLPGTLHFSYHVGGLLFGCRGKAWETALRAQYPSVPGVIDRPVRIVHRPSSDLPSMAAYTLKSYHLARSQYLAVPKTSDRNPYRNTRDIAMPRDVDIRLQITHSKYRVCDPLILIGLKRWRTSDPAQFSFGKAGKGHWQR